MEVRSIKRLTMFPWLEYPQAFYAIQGMSGGMYYHFWCYDAYDIEYYPDYISTVDFITYN